MSTPTSAAPASVVIIGGGLAGAKAAQALREKGYTGPVTLIAAEQLAPYERPPLSKSYLAGESEFEKALVHPLAWYGENDIDLRLGTRATAVDAKAHTVTLSDGSTVDYGKLILATGAVPRHLRLPGSDAAGVLYLREKADADAIAANIGDGKKLVIIGAGWIGLEVASAARTAGADVTVIEMAALPLLAVLGDELAQVFADLHTAHGVKLELSASLAEILVTDGHARGVRLADGREFAADAVVVGIGITPNIELAQAAGLAVDNGVLVDASLRSSDPDIYAVGDIANHDHPVIGQRVRVEHWANALNQPATAVAALLGEDASFASLPYFFSDQFDLGMEYVGYAPRGSYSQVVIRGELATREFVAFWLDGQNRIKAAMNVNVWDVPDAVKPLITAGTVVNPKRLADKTVAYADL